ncbi:MAG: cation:proton antiporter, partial [Gammaproteobacteria bacterium]
MQENIIAIGLAFLFGLGARLVGLPPLVGYLIAGFVLFAAGMEATPTLHQFSEIGVTLLLFSIGLKMRIGSLLMPQVWGVASLHMGLTVLLFATGIFAFGALGVTVFSGLDVPLIFLVGFALCFSSTVFAVKVLEEKGEMNAVYGRISIGILIMQD